MIATIINALAVVAGGLVGLFAGRRIEKNKALQDMVFIGIGIITLVIGMMMALRTQRILYLALSLVVGGLVGHWIGIERGISLLGEKIHAVSQTRANKRQKNGTPEIESVPGEAASIELDGRPGSAQKFAVGFLEASVLFCAGSMAILGSIQAGIEGQYGILLTKSVMDGFMAILLAASLGAGVVYSALAVFAYQGILTAAAGLIGAAVPELVLTEISGIGGGMILMIGLNLLGLKKIPTANFLPGLVFVVVLALLDPWLPGVLKI